jgi:hypothetical protein
VRRICRTFANKAVVLTNRSAEIAWVRVASSSFSAQRTRDGSHGPFEDAQRIGKVDARPIDYKWTCESRGVEPREAILKKSPLFASLADDETRALASLIVSIVRCFRFSSLKCLTAPTRTPSPNRNCCSAFSRRDRF